MTHVTPQSDRGVGETFAAAAGQVLAATLDNGLQVLIWPDARIPSVTLHHWVLAGSRDEQDGKTGLAHFFEHMMFSGTERFPNGEFDRLIESHGGSCNAFTSADATVFQGTVPRESLELLLTLESDRFAHCRLDPLVLETERQVVLSERRGDIEDDASAVLAEHVQALGYLWHPYRHPIIGWARDIERWTLADLESFHRRLYAPSNRVLVLVGDVDPTAALECVRRHFGGGRPAPLPSRPPAEDPSGARRLLLERGDQDLLHCAYPALAAADADEPALHLLQLVLLAGHCSRLHRSLVERERLAVGVEGGWEPGFNPTPLRLLLTPAARVSLARLEKALDRELQQLVHHGITAHELHRAKSLAAMDFWQAISTIEGKARLLGDYAVLHGDYRLLFNAPLRDEAVTVEAIGATARRILDPHRRVVGWLRREVA